jgi:hypothetical protein
MGRLADEGMTVAAEQVCWQKATLALFTFIILCRRSFSSLNGSFPPIQKPA